MVLNNELLESIYENLDEEIEILATLGICTILLVLLLLSFLTGLCISCVSSKKNAYVPPAYFKNALCKTVEDTNIYLSEVSPSTDSLSSSSTNSRTNSIVTTIPEETANKKWLPLELLKHMKKSESDTLTTIKLFLKFVSSDVETNQHGKLHISIKNIISLPTKDYPRYTEAYLILQLVRTQRKFKGQNETIIAENRTRNFRNTRIIEVDEHFVLDTKQNDLKNVNLVLKAYDEDVYTKPSEIASAVISLSRKYKEICRREGIEITTLLKHVPKNVVGHILVGLSYLPTSQRLAVNIVRVANLPQPHDANRKLYAELFLLTGVTGKSLRKRKLLFNPSKDDPYELNGNVSFDVTPSLLETVTLLIILYEESTQTRIPVYEDPVELADDKNVETNSDHCYGSVAIGKLVSNGKGKKHWRMMLVAPRRVVTVWHPLK